MTRVPGMCLSCKCVTLCINVTGGPPREAIWHRYRIARNLTSGDYLGPRIGDKILIALIIFSLYWGVGDKDADPSGMTNISAVLFM